MIFRVNFFTITTLFSLRGKLATLRLWERSEEQEELSNLLAIKNIFKVIDKLDFLKEPFHDISRLR